MKNLHSCCGGCGRDQAQVVYWGEAFGHGFESQTCVFLLCFLLGLGNANN